MKTLSEKNKTVFIRFPIIPGITDTDDNIESVINLMLDLRNIEQINLLPYHRTADSKYSRFHIENKMAGFGHQYAEKLDSIKTNFERDGFIVKIGG